jgi:DNA adenine methylase
MSYSIHQINEGPMNISQVSKLSPFRYPGGKTWFVPHIKRWLGNQTVKPSMFIEPFCGGGIIGLTVAALDLSEKVIFCELDADVAAVWHCCLSKIDSERLAHQILDFTLTIDSAKQILESTPANTLERAFRTIVFNRVSRGGVTAQGAGILNRGENNKGITSRWYPRTLADRIVAISKLESRIKFVEGDAFTVIAEYGEKSDAAFFVDPPYTAGSGKRAGSRLYKHNALDHEKLYDVMAKVEGPFLMTYDDDEDVIAMARDRKFDVARVVMRNTHHREVFELVVTNTPFPDPPPSPIVITQPYM